MKTLTSFFASDPTLIVTIFLLGFLAFGLFWAFCGRGKPKKRKHKTKLLTGLILLTSAAAFGQAVENFYPPNGPNALVHGKFNGDGAGLTNIPGSGFQSPLSLSVPLLGTVQTNTGAIKALEFVGSGAKLTGVVAIITNNTVYATGTAYTLTASSAALDFGTTDPNLTIATTGTYLIIANVGVKYNGATYVAAQTVTFKLRRTNNTAADVANGSRAVELPVLTTFTGGDVMTLPPVIYTATAGDIVTIFGILSSTPSAGSVLADSAELVAIRIY